MQRIFQRACYDCHSVKTRWPWYSYLPPISMWIRHDVDDGRKRLNFSAWQDYAADPGTEDQKLTKISGLMKSGAMPPWYYTAMHPGAKLSDSDRAVVNRWIAAEKSSHAGAIDSPDSPAPHDR